MGIKRVDGWLWPDTDTECQKVAFDLSSLKAAVDLCSLKRVAIQAGGNVGIWPAALAAIFDAVYTAEPDDENFACLCANVTERNVYKFQCGFGFIQQTSSLNEKSGNCGAGYIEGSGNIPILKIDDLHLSNVDLIALDVEGMEFPALLGAVHTIQNYRPVILVEEKQLGRRYGYDDEGIGRWLTEHGYEIANKVHRDVIYKHKGI